MFKARVIRNEIARQLLGAEWGGLSKVDAACAELPMEALLRGEIADTLAEAFGGVVPLPAEPAPAPSRTTAREFLSGDAVHRAVPDPAKGIRFQPADLYGDLLT